MTIPTIQARLICRVDGAPVEPLLRGVEEACELKTILDHEDPQRPVVVGYVPIEVLGAVRRRGGQGPYAGDGVWAEVWTIDFQLTPYALFVRDHFEADEQLDLLSAALGHPRDDWTIKPPRGWDRYGIPAAGAQ